MEFTMEDLTAGIGGFLKNSGGRTKRKPQPGAPVYGRDYTIAIIGTAVIMLFTVIMVFAFKTK